MTTTFDKEGQHDRELLELAAKAAGIDIEFSIFKDESFICFHSGGDCFNSEWNPLLDDGDAFRIMVKLEIAINPYAGKVVTWSEANRMAGTEKWDSDDGAAEAVRRAIVRAAAEIGKTL